MNILVLGGTGFVGRHLVEELLRHDHNITLFNRGRSAPGLFDHLESVIGDREVSHDALRDRKFDAVIDTNGRMPLSVQAAAKLLAPNVGHYSFISSISAYAAMQPGSDTGEKVITEDSKLAPLPPEKINDTSVMTYGGRKAECERLATLENKGKILIIRPGLVVGPEDSTDRFTYWPVRCHEGGDVLAPGDGSDEVRFIDARDLAIWIVHLVEQRKHGVFNAIRPEQKYSMKQLLADCTAATTTPSQVHWIPKEFLESKEVRPWSDLPAWAPGLVPIDSSRPFSHGLRCRPVSETAADTIEWALKTGKKRPLLAGLSPEREADVLAAWRETL